DRVPDQRRVILVHERRAHERIAVRVGPRREGADRPGNLPGKQVEVALRVRGERGVGAFHVDSARVAQDELAEDLEPLAHLAVGDRFRIRAGDARIRDVHAASSSCAPGSAGIESVTVVPEPSWLSIRSLPPWASAMPRAIGIPSPRPADLNSSVFEEWCWSESPTANPCSARRRWCSGSMPTPVSVTENTRRSRAREALTSTRPPSGVNRTALLTRCTSARTRLG